MVITDIKNTKIKVENEEHKYEILTKANEYGFISLRSVPSKYKTYLYFTGGMDVLTGICKFSFNEHQEKEIFFYNGEFHDKPQDELFVSCSLDDIFEADKAKHKLFEIGFIYYQGEWVPKEEIEKQKADEEIKEIAEFIRSMCVKHRAPKGDEISIDAAKALHEAGYRKGEL